MPLLLARFRLPSDDDGLDGAPVSFALAVHVVDAAVFPLGEGGGEGGGVDVVGGGIDDKGDPAGAAIDLEFAGIEVVGVAAPAPGDKDLAVEDGDFDFGGEGGPVGSAGEAADDAHVGADLRGESGVVFHLLDAGEDAVERAFLDGDDGGESAGGGIGGGWGGRDEAGEDEE